MPRSFPAGRVAPRPGRVARGPEATRRPLPIPHGSRGPEPRIQGGPRRAPPDLAPRVGRGHPSDAGPARLLGAPRQPLRSEVRVHELAAPPPPAAPAPPPPPPRPPPH